MAEKIVARETRRQNERFERVPVFMKIDRGYERIKTVCTPCHNKEGGNAMNGDRAHQTPMTRPSNNHSSERPNSCADHVGVCVHCLRVATNVIILSKLHADA